MADRTCLPQAGFEKSKIPLPRPSPLGGRVRGGLGFAFCNWKKLANVSVVIQKCLSLICHSGLDPESSDFHLDFRFRGNDGFGINIKKC